MRLAILLSVAALAAGCRSSRVDYREASLAMSTHLLSQLTERTDVRRVRLRVNPFKRVGAVRAVKVKRGRLYYGDPVDTEVAERFEQALVSDLAQRVRVMEEGDSANTLLKGSFDFVDKREVRIEMTVVDMDTNEVLATSAGVMENR
ncbi:MAG: hypothetical protein ACYTGN_13245 [Planctomycetota bacterium]|jgi:hypothetical protein